jgi:Na+/proline symporter
MTGLLASASPGLMHALVLGAGEGRFGVVIALAWPDVLVLACYGLALGLVGVLLARRARGGGSAPANADEYFVAARSMPAWAVALSILATAQSAATFLGAPQQGASGDLRYLLANVGVLIAAVVTCVVFLPAYFRRNVQTPYGLLECAFGPATRRAASVWYLCGRLMASGARVYIGAIPFCLAVTGEVTPLGLLACVGAFMAFGAVFTLASGARGAIWTDVVQVVVYVSALVVLALVVLGKLPGGTLEGLSSALAGPQGTGPVLIGPASDSLELWREFTPLTCVTGVALLNLAFFAMDQDLTQRLLSCKSSTQAARSLMISTVLVTLPVVAGFVALGLLLGAYFRGLEPGAALAVGDERMLMQFALAHSPAGVAGLMLAGVLAAGPAGINSSLNAMASSFVSDLYRPLRPGLSDAQAVRAGRVATVVIGVLMALFASACVYWHSHSDKSIISFALSVMIYAYAGLAGVFIAAVTLRHPPPWSGLVALPLGTGTVVALSFVQVQAPTPSGLAPLAWPWQLVGGTLAAFGVCALARLAQRRGPAAR